MKRNSTLAATVLAIGLSLASFERSISAEKPLESTKEIMKASHKGETSMVKRISEGKGTEDEIKQLLSYYHTMQKQEPPRGSKESWEQKVAVLIKSTERLSVRESGSLEQFKQAVNCKACHSEHKPE